MDKYQERLMSTYKKVNPSEIKIEDSNLYGELSAVYEDLFLRKLKFPPKMFRDCSVVEIGCGTGETSVILSKWADTYTAVDPNPYSIERAQRLNVLTGSNVLFQIGSFENIHDSIKGEHDIVFSQGVLHHLTDPETGFRNASGILKKNGYFILLYGDFSGYFQRALQRLIIKAMSDGSEDDIERSARKYFGEHLERAHKYGRRAIKSIVYDTYVIPRIRKVTLMDLRKWSKECGLEIYSSYPEAGPPMRCDSYIRPVEALTHESSDIFEMLLALRWIFTQHSDKDVFDHLAGDRSRDILVKFNSFMDQFDSITSDRPFRQEELGFFRTALMDFRNELLQYVDLLSGEIIGQIRKKFDSLDLLIGEVEGRNINADDLSKIDLMKGHAGVGLNAIILHKRSYR